MSDGFDARELDNFAKQLLELATEKFPRETTKFLRTEGNKLRRKTLSKAKSLVNKDSGKYFRSIKRGKAYKNKLDEQSVRVYSSNRDYNNDKEHPTAHLIEYGHRIVTPDGREVGFARGFKVFEKARNDFEEEYFQDCEQFIDDMLDKGLR